PAAATQNGKNPVDGKFIIAGGGGAARRNSKSGRLHEGYRDSSGDYASGSDAAGAHGGISLYPGRYQASVIFSQRHGRRPGLPARIWLGRSRNRRTPAGGGDGAGR